MKKIIALCALCVVMTGCGKVDRAIAGWTGGASQTCVDGVKYLQFTSGASVKYKRDGSIENC